MVTPCPPAAADLALLAHHGDVDVPPGAVDFAVNVRHRQLPPWLREHLSAALDQLGGYPSAQRAQAVREQIAAHHGVDPAAVLLLGGASEGFTLLAAHVWARLPGPALLLAPSYTEPEAALRRVGVPIRRAIVPPPFTLPVQPAHPVWPVLDDVSIAIAGNPTNPTGVLHPAAAVAALQPPSGILAVDEAFMDLADDGDADDGDADARDTEPESLAGEIVPGRVVLRSLTKTWALAGLRVGYAVGDPELLAALAATRPPWSIGTMQLAAFEAVFSARGRTELAAERAQVRRERAHMRALLAAAEITLAADSAAPFVLVHLPAGCDAAAFRAHLAHCGIAVRRCDTFPGLDWHAPPTQRHHLRLAVRPPDQVEQLITAWRRAHEHTYQETP